LSINDEKIKKMRETIEWGEETLLAWNSDLAKISTDNKFLETYNLQDDARFKVITKPLVTKNVKILMKSLYYKLFRN